MKFLGTLLAASLVLLSAQGHSDQARIKQEMIDSLEAYAVYKMARFDEAFERFMSLAERGNIQGILNVANMYQQGEGVDRDPAQAVYWYGKGAEKNDPQALFSLAEAYEKGLGIDIDIDKAMELYSRAAELGSEAAIVRLNPEPQPQSGQDRIVVGEGESVEQSARHRLLVLELLRSLDLAANNRDVKALTAHIQPAARIRVKLPGAPGLQDMDLATYQGLWSATFTESKNYRFVRRQSKIQRVQDGLQVESIIRETLGLQTSSRSLQLTEKLLIRFVDDEARIQSISLIVEPT